MEVCQLWRAVMITLTFGNGLLGLDMQHHLDGQSEGRQAMQCSFQAFAQAEQSHSPEAAGLNFLEYLFVRLAQLGHCKSCHRLGPADVEAYSRGHDALQCLEAGTSLKALMLDAGGLRDAEGCCPVLIQP